MTTQRLNSDTRRLGKFDHSLRVTVTPNGYSITNGKWESRLDCPTIRDAYWWLNHLTHKGN